MLIKNSENLYSLNEFLAYSKKSGETLLWQFIIFIFTIFLIPSVAVSLYALATHRLLKDLKVRVKLATLVTGAVILSLIQISLTYLPIEYASLLGTALLIISATHIALGMNTSLIPFENRISEKQKTFMILSFSLVLAIIALWSFSSVMGTPSGSIDVLGFVDYRSVMKYGKVAFHFISSLILYMESILVALGYYALCYFLLGLE